MRSLYKIYVNSAVTNVCNIGSILVTSAEGRW